jgi:hypothetical protein
MAEAHAAAQRTKAQNQQPTPCTLKISYPYTTININASGIFKTASMISVQVISHKVKR